MRVQNVHVCQHAFHHSQGMPCECVLHLCVCMCHVGGGLSKCHVKILHTCIPCHFPHWDMSAGRTGEGKFLLLLMICGCHYLWEDWYYFSLLALINLQYALLVCCMSGRRRTCCITERALGYVYKRENDRRGLYALLVWTGTSKRPPKANKQEIILIHVFYPILRWIYK